eukprot:TRINITY_DN3388_c0_g1_i1.p1 TRINITY_DN3388_c0_g1~~TRINITY_DN3388_c0_g1_i1.p1  ORF type:complete len:818 (-),score=348.96 TRINITY_DN3388_c0_g1_i1:146-2599(-)
MSELEAFLDQVKIPDASSKVYKNECAFSFDNPESEDGVYIDMSRFQAFGRKFVNLNYQKTGQRIYLRVKKTKVLKEEAKTTNESSEVPEPPLKKPTVLGIGIPGGFDSIANKYDVIQENSIVIIPEFKSFSLENPQIPSKVQESAVGILSADPPKVAEVSDAWYEEVVESKYSATLKQLDNGVKIPNSGWKCHKCDLTTNLWLNLTDGTIGCGRSQIDLVTRQNMGNEHASAHYKATGYPLAVKLGTITKDGKGDVYSYGEDATVLDPLLPQHLQHFGINVVNLEKTEATTEELDVERNSNSDWMKLTEGDKQLKTLFGPGYTGMENIGNSCYLASVMQSVFTIPEFQKRYFEDRNRIFETAGGDVNQDFQVQMAKLGNGLLSGEYSIPSRDAKDEHLQAIQDGIAPKAFKTLIGKGHHEFSTAKQQDALEFLQYLLTVIEKDEKKRGDNRDVSKVFRFEVEERLECSQSHRVKYVKRQDNVLSLPIPLEKAKNLKEVHADEAKRSALSKEELSNLKEDPVRPTLTFADCVEALTNVEEISDFYSSAIGGKTTGLKHTRLATFPDYLIVQLRKFYVASDWTPKKLDAIVEVPEEIDLNEIRGKGLQPGEQALPDSDASNAKEEFNVDSSIVEQLLAMGFEKNPSERAVFETKNEGIEAASNWYLTHMDDADFMAPLPKPQASASSKPEVKVDEAGIEMIMAMGFPRDAAIRALKATDNNIERAADWIFSHADDPVPMEEAPQSSSASPSSASSLTDGNGKYKLLSIISHMGTSTLSGHYVCHIKKDGQWVLFNDNKVAVSEHPPTDLGYIYLFERSK